MVIRTKGGDWMSTLAFTFTENNGRSSLRTGSDVVAAGGGLKPRGV